MKRTGLPTLIYWYKIGGGQEEGMSAERQKGWVGGLLMDKSYEKRVFRRLSDIGNEYIC